MRIVQIGWRSYRVPFRGSFATAHGSTPAREGIIVQVTTDGGITGNGEIAPLPSFSKESLQDALELLPTLAARLSSKTLDEALNLIPTREQTSTNQSYEGMKIPEGTRKEMPLQAASYGRGIPLRVPSGDKTSDKISSTHFGLETALLDALGKAQGLGLSSLLTPPGFTPRKKVPVNAVIGAKSLDGAIAEARAAVHKGFACVKLKVGMGRSITEEVERVAAIREVIGPATRLRLDANEAWSLEQAIAILSGCLPYEIQYVEQPLKADDLAGMGQLRQAVPLLIAVDETVRDIESAQRILDSEVADILVIKPQLAGGLRMAQQIIQLAAQRGVSSVITSTLETGIGVAAALHLAAASPTIILECGLATLDKLEDDLIEEGLAVIDGQMTVPTGPGLGVSLDEAALRRYTIREESY